MGWFNRKPKHEKTELPASLEAALAGLTVAHRTPVDGAGRVLLCWPSEQTSSWHHSREETRKRIAAAWPELTDPQLDRAMRAVAGRIRATAETQPRRKRDNWATQWKSRSLENLPE